VVKRAYKGFGRLAGWRALITGWDSGIGRAVAIAFAREGADVAIDYLAGEEADAKDTLQPSGLPRSEQWHCQATLPRRRAASSWFMMHASSLAAWISWLMSPASKQPYSSVFPGSLAKVDAAAVFFRDQGVRID